MKHSFWIAPLLLMASALSGQSLWNPQRPMPSLFSNTSARNVGDILTIVVSETQRITNKDITQLQKETTLDSALTSFNILPKAFNPLPSVSAGSKHELNSNIKYDKQGSMTTRISVVVIDVLPNGNLVVEGRRRITMDREHKTIRLTGFVRPYDVTADNTVSSSQIANASIAYEGVGPTSQASNHGWLSDLLSYAWPF